MSAPAPSDTPETSRGPTLPAVQQHLVTPAAPVTGRVVATRHCTAGGSKAAGHVRHIEIDVSGTPLEGTFRAGQSFGVVPPGTDDRGRPHKLRLYSLACPTAGEDGGGKTIATTVKRTIDEHWDTHKLFLGVCSNYLCDLDEGDEIQVTGPVGKRFLLPEDPASHDYIFIATGTGIAPFRGMLADLAAAGFPSRAALVMGAPYHTDLLYHDHFERLSDEHDNFGYLPALSRQPHDDGSPAAYVQDRLARHGELVEMLRSDRTLIYVCGIAGMELGILRALAGVLTPEELAQYLQVAPEAGDDPAGWTRRMIPRKIKPSGRVFLEVY